MWLASQYTVRAGADWSQGAQEMYRHLLDGSVAANWLGWQWTIGAGTGKPYGFSRWQVNKRAPELCEQCSLSNNCPIEEWPDTPAGPARQAPAALGKLDPTQAAGHLGAGAGPATAERDHDAPEPEAVWLTAESLGSADPALLAHPQLPAVFVFDEPLLASLRLSGKRLVFLAETVAELGAEVRLGDPITELRGRPLAATWTYVPGWQRRAAALDVVVRYPWPWLRRPDSGSMTSYSTWVRRRNG
jgi:deoxyribodipyrimidine photo-lyase